MLLWCWFIKKLYFSDFFKIVNKDLFLLYIEFDFKICNNIYIYVFCVYYICNLVVNVIEGVIIIVIVL